MRNEKREKLWKISSLHAIRRDFLHSLSLGSPRLALPGDFYIPNLELVQLNWQMDSFDFDFPLFDLFFLLSPLCTWETNFHLNFRCCETNFSLYPNFFWYFWTLSPRKWYFNRIEDYARLTFMKFWIIIIFSYEEPCKCITDSRLMYNSYNV